MMAVGLSASEAVQRALGISLSEFGRRNGFRQTEVSMCLLGYPDRGYPEIRDAICAELGITRDFLDAKIEEQAAVRASA